MTALIETTPKRDLAIQDIEHVVEVPKQGVHAVGVKRQSCGELGKRANCQAGLNITRSLKRLSLLPHKARN